MRLSDLGERKTIEKISRFLPIGDDAAVIRHGREYLVISTDVIYEKTHIPEEMTARQIGKFIASINISDVAAMGAKPRAFLLSCSIPDMEYSFFEDIIKSAKKQCSKYGVEYVGGDTKQNQSITLAGFCLGTTKKPVLRSGAKKGDIVAVTGTLGDAALGFELIKKNLPMKLKKKLLKKAFEPEPRVSEGLIISEYASSMTDLSDGLSTGLHNIADSSGVAIEVHIDKLPVSKEAVKACCLEGLNITRYALHGGGDYELLFTLPEKDFEKIERKTCATKIGRVTGGRGVKAVHANSITKLGNLGYEHFKINQ